MVLTGASMSNINNKKKTKGRKKIEIKKIEENNSRQVTFSKRRTGLFKKASELCILTGAQIAILVNSPGGRVYAFGHPNVDSLLDRYINNNNNNDGGGGGNNNNIVINNKSYGLPPLPTKEFNEHYVEVSKELEAEKKRMEMVPSSSSGGMRWFEAEVDGMGVEELEEYLWSLGELKKKVLTRADELMMMNKSNVVLGGGGGGGGGGGSSVFEMWGSGGQTVGGMVDGAVHGGFGFQHGGEIGKF